MAVLKRWSGSSWVTGAVPKDWTGSAWGTLAVKERQETSPGVYEWVKIWPPDPAIATCTIGPSGSTGVEVNWDTGVQCESVIVELVDDATDNVVSSKNIGTAPETSGYSTTFLALSDGTYYARIRPFSADGQTGTEGTACQTGTQTISGGPA